MCVCCVLLYLCIRASIYVCVCAHSCLFVFIFKHLCLYVCVFCAHCFVCMLMCVCVFSGPSTPPADLQLSALDSSSVLVSWRPPLEPNGIIISYRILFSCNVSQPEHLWTNSTHNGASNTRTYTHTHTHTCTTHTLNQHKPLCLTHTHTTHTHTHTHFLKENKQETAEPLTERLFLT